MEGANAGRGTGDREAERQWLLYFESLKLTSSDRNEEEMHDQGRKQRVYVGSKQRTAGAICLQHL